MFNYLLPKLFEIHVLIYLCRIGIIHIEGKTSGKRFWQFKTYAQVINVIQHVFIRRSHAPFRRPIAIDMRL